MNIDIDAFALLINEKGSYLAKLYRTSGYLNGTKLPERNRHGKVKLSDALFFKQMLDTDDLTTKRVKKSIQGKS
ncbi:TPA: hypothetical protein I7721_14050 [Vibrio vulnificus]|nr:hypothetical protein [Vibrio vulnificus]